MCQNKSKICNNIDTNKQDGNNDYEQKDDMMSIFTGTSGRDDYLDGGDSGDYAGRR